MSELIGKIKSTIEKLDSGIQETPSHLNFSLLRDLRNYCRKQMFENDVSLNVAVCFFIEKFLEELITNFDIDALYTEKLNRARIEMYNYFVASLPQIEKALISKDQDSIIGIMGNVIQTYGEKISLLNKN